jgi:hypothetical protein
LSVNYKFYNLPTRGSPSIQKVFEKINKNVNVDGFKIITHSNNYDSRVKYNNHDDDDVMDVSWFNELNENIINLPPRDLIALSTYTYVSDIILNTYLRDHKKAIYEFLLSMHHKFSSDSISLTFFYPLMEIFERYKDKLKRCEDKYEILSSLMDTKKMKINSNQDNINNILSMNLSINYFEQLKTVDKIKYIQNLEFFCFKFLKDDILEE